MDAVHSMNVTVVLSQRMHGGEEERVRRCWGGRQKEGEGQGRVR